MQTLQDVKEILARLQNIESRAFLNAEAISESGHFGDAPEHEREQVKKFAHALDSLAAWVKHYK